MKRRLQYPTMFLLALGLSACGGGDDVAQKKYGVMATGAWKLTISSGQFFGSYMEEYDSSGRVSYTETLVDNHYRPIENSYTLSESDVELVRQAIIDADLLGQTSDVHSEEGSADGGVATYDLSYGEENHSFDVGGCNFDAPRESLVQLNQTLSDLKTRIQSNDWMLTISVATTQTIFYRNGDVLVKKMFCGSGGCSSTSTEDTFYSLSTDDLKLLDEAIAAADLFDEKNHEVSSEMCDSFDTTGVEYQVGDQKIAFSLAPCPTELPSHLDALLRLVGELEASLQ